MTYAAVLGSLRLRAPDSSSAGSRSEKRVLPGRLSTSTTPPIARGELVDDREAEAGSDRPATRIARVEEEALEGARDLVRLAARGRRPRPRAGRGRATMRTEPPGGETRSAFSTRFESAWRMRSASPRAQRIAGRVEDELDPVGVGLRLVAAMALGGDLAEVDRLAANAELVAVHPREVEQVAHEAVEALRLLRR